MSQSPQTPVIDWPFWGQPFEHTPRGYLCRRKTSGAMFRAFFAVFVFTLPIVFLFQFIFIKRMDFVPALLSWIFIPGIAGFIAASLVSVLLVRPIRPVVREAREEAERWRPRWLDFEQSSLALQQQIREAGYRLEDAFTKCPYAPSYFYRLQDPVSIVLPECGIPLDRQEAIERAPHLMEYGLSAVLCNLARIGGRMVVGRTANAGIVAILAPLNGYQVWVQVEFERSGDALVPRLLTGFQTWSHRFQDNLGKRYPGDMVSIKRHHRGIYGNFLLFAFPIWGWIQGLITLGAFVSEYLRTDQAASLRAELWPAGGDSTDVVIISGFKQAIPGASRWVLSTRETQDMLDSMKRRILEVVTTSLGRTV